MLENNCAITKFLTLYSNLLHFTKEEQEVRNKRSHLSQQAISELLAFYPKQIAF